MKKTITAFYDILLYSIISVPLIILSLYIFFYGNYFSDSEWLIKNWHLVAVFALGLAIPIGSIQLIRFFKIVNNESVYFHYFPFTTNWEKAADNIDIRWNQEMFISEIESIEIVKLSRAEKKQVFYKHWGNKYLKINLKYGKNKFVYIGNYSKQQIEKIIKLMLTKR